MSLIYKEHELARSGIVSKGKTFSIRHLQSLVQGQLRVEEAVSGKVELTGSQSEKERMATMQNSKVKELMSSLERVEVNEALEALSEAR